MIDQNPDMGSGHVRVRVHGASGTIILDRQEKRNALNRDMLRDLKQAFDDLHQERRVRAIVLTGAGSCFCSGIDLGEMQVTSKSDNAMAQWHLDVVQYKELLEVLLRFPRPIIAAVNGPVMAAGAGLVLAADIVVAANDASIGFPEPKRGLVAGVAAPLLSFRVGGGRAAKMLLTGGTLESAAAAQAGLFHELVAPDQVWVRANQLANEIADTAAESLQLTKRLLNETIGESLSTLMTAGAAMSAAARTTEAAQEGIAAFLEHRPPTWP